MSAICDWYDIQVEKGFMKNKVKVRDVPVAEVHKARKEKEYTGPKLPFPHVNCMTAKAFRHCMKGILISDLVTWVKAQGGEPRRILRVMRAGECRGKKWSVDENNGYLRIEYKG